MRDKNRLAEWLYNHSSWFWVLFFGLIFVFMLFGCENASQLERDTVYVTKTDTRYLERVDSVYIDRWHKEVTDGDTVYLRDSVLVYRYRLIHDTTALTDTIYITKTEKEVVEEKSSSAELWGLIIIGIIFGTISLVEALKKAKNA